MRHFKQKLRLTIYISTIFLSTLLLGFKLLTNPVHITGHLRKNPKDTSAYVGGITVIVKGNNKLIAKTFTDRHGNFELTFTPKNEKSFDFYCYGLAVDTQQFDTVLLTLTKYEGQTKVENYFICPDYDAKIGIQKAKVNFIDFDYWEGCETGKGKCKPLNFTRTKDEKNWYLILPCGGTETSINFSNSDNTFLQKQHLFYENCSPYL